VGASAMELKNVVLVGVLTLASSAPLSAQSVGKMIVTDVRNAAGDIVDVWESPFHASAKSWLQAAGIVGGSAMLSLVDDNVDRFMVRTQNDPFWSSLKELREGGVGFSGRTIAPFAVGIYVVGLATKSTALRDGVFGCVSSYLAQSAVRSLIFYQFVNRERPDSSRKHESPPPPPAQQGDQYNFKFHEPLWGMQSFPAGHVANVAGCASFLTNRFSMGVVEPALWVVVAGVGVGRMVDRRHWTSDTVLGTALGYAIGKEVAKRSSDRLQRDQSTPTVTDERQRGFYLTPSSHGVTLGWHATF
jgi:membrane-associated phospholipid phosphatase